MQAILRENCFQETHDSQKTFRKIMDAIARPGTVEQLDAPQSAFCPVDLPKTILSCAKTLLDDTVGFWASDFLPVETTQYLSNNTHSKVVACEDAEYLFFDGRVWDHQFLGVNSGTLEFPEDGAGIFIIVDSLDADGAMELMLQGPGVLGVCILKIAGLVKEYVQALKVLNKYPPAGVDVFFLSQDGKIAALPRSTEIKGE